MRCIRMVIFCEYTVDPVFFSVKIIKACLKLNNDKYYYANCNTRCKTSNIYDRIVFIAYKISESYFKIIFYHGLYFYSVRNDFTGFAIAAFSAWKPTVANAIITAIIPAIINTHQPMLIR